MPGRSVNDIVITALGASTPVGTTAGMTCAAIRAGISRISEHAFYECLPVNRMHYDFLCLNAAAAPWIDPYLDGPERLLRLAEPALRDLLHNAEFVSIDGATGSLFLAIPQSDDATVNWFSDTDFITELCRSGQFPNFRMTKTSRTGRTGVFAHITEAAGLLESGELNYCIVGGVDSWLSETRLKLLDEAWRLKSDRNVDGFIPGEAAVMLLLETTSHALMRGKGIKAQIWALGFGVEPETILSDKVSTGAGLADALNGIIDLKENGHYFESVYCDLNGESYSSFEWGLMHTRAGTALEHVRALIHPADCIGDIGAATGGLLVACASTAFERGYHIGDESLLWTASDDGQRMALALQAAPEPETPQ